MARRPPAAPANECRTQESVFFPDDLREAVTTFHRSCGYDRTVQESIRELIWQGLSGDAKSTAIRLAARRAYLDTKILMLTRLGGTLKTLWGEVEELVNVTAAEATVTTALEEPRR